MIEHNHPVLAAIAAAPWTFHLVGSRYVGVFRDDSDYDFLLECEQRDWLRHETETDLVYPIRDWLVANGFKPQGKEGYGKDSRVYGSNVWEWRDVGPVFAHSPRKQSVDVIPVTPAEAKRRLNAFDRMKKVGHEKAGLVCRALKHEQAWGYFWELWPLDEHGRVRP